MTYLEFRRRQLGLTQRALGNLVGIRQNWISYTEIGRALPTPEERQRLARVLSVPADKLLEQVPDDLVGSLDVAPVLAEQRA